MKPTARCRNLAAIGRGEGTENLVWLGREHPVQAYGFG
jgi:hypothetical protein